MMYSRSIPGSCANVLCLVEICMCYHSAYNKSANKRPSDLPAYCMINSIINATWNGSQEQLLTHWGRVTHICVSKLTSICSDNGLSPGWCQAIIWTDAGLSLIGPFGTQFSEILIEIDTFSFKKMHLKVSSGKCQPFCLGLFCLSLNVLTHWG